MITDQLAEYIRGALFQAPSQHTHHEHFSATPARNSALPSSQAGWSRATAVQARCSHKGEPRCRACVHESRSAGWERAEGEKLSGEIGLGRPRRGASMQQWVLQEVWAILCQRTCL